MERLKKILLLLLVSCLVVNCVEPYDPGIQSFEDSLVVQGTITDEFKFQKVTLSRTFPLSDSIPRYEIGANVMVVDELMNEYAFEEREIGVYVSMLPFKAELNRSYQLKITTSLGRNYTSVPVSINNGSSELGLRVEKGMNDDGIEGIFIYANSYDPDRNSERYRYEYEETYKIIAPYWSPLDAYGNPMAMPTADPFYHEVFTRPRTKEERICYNTLQSNVILLTETNQLSEDRITDYQILFLPKDDFKISHRYSINVRQLIESTEAYSYYSSLDKFASPSNVFSQSQVGFVQGNLYSEEDSNENVIGYFDVAAASSQRIFFNYEDYFPTEPKPPHIVYCDLITPDLDDHSLFASPYFSPLLTLLTYQEMKFVDFTKEPWSNNPMIIVRKECGDCTTLGTNVMPDFWID